MRNYDAAIADFTQAISLKSDDPRLYQMRAQTWTLKRDAANALIDLTEYLRLRPGDVDAHLRRALLFADERQFEQAVNDFTEILRLEPENAIAYAVRACCRVELGQLELAADDAAASVRIEPRAAEAWQARAYVRTAHHDYRQAVDDLSGALELVDKSSRASIGSDLAWLLATCPDERIRDGKRSLELSRAAIAQFPHDADVQDTLAAAFAETGDFTRAVYWVTKAIEESGHESDRSAMQKRLALYQNKQPYRTDGVNAGGRWPRERSSSR
jgi:tetratricopeptide (TPR) repeat protein